MAGAWGLVLDAGRGSSGAPVGQPGQVGSWLATPRSQACVAGNHWTTALASRGHPEVGGAGQREKEGQEEEKERKVGEQGVRPAEPGCAGTERGASCQTAAPRRETRASARRSPSAPLQAEQGATACLAAFGLGTMRGRRPGQAHGPQAEAGAPRPPSNHHHQVASPPWGFCRLRHSRGAKASPLPGRVREATACCHQERVRRMGTRPSGAGPRVQIHSHLHAA